MHLGSYFDYILSAPLPDRHWSPFANPLPGLFMGNFCIRAAAKVFSLRIVKYIEDKQIGNMDFLVDNQF